MWCWVLCVWRWSKAPPPQHPKPKPHVVNLSELEFNRKFSRKSWTRSLSLRIFCDIFWVPILNLCWGCIQISINSAPVIQFGKSLIFNSMYQPLLGLELNFSPAQFKGCDVALRLLFNVTKSKSKLTKALIRQEKGDG